MRQGNELYTAKETEEAWSKAAAIVQTYSDELVHRWNNEIDTYLVYAGLFSAILTAFNVQSYLLLQPTPTAGPDPTVLLLLQISSTNPSFVNTTQPSTAQSTNENFPPPVPRWAVWLNTLWFSGLVLSLTSASIGIMVKQWLNEYTSGIPGTSLHAAKLRQYRLNNLKRWHVEHIVLIIPVLLQLALALFLAGLLVLLWNLHHTVAAVISTLVGLLGIFTIVATLLPLYDNTCAYLTPPTRLI
ncbi:hypothetical protein BC628DRAFT_1329511, partial [Trametes gibbosa]